MLKQFLPNQFAKSVFEIKPEDLKEKGIKAIITDLDNTLVEWDRTHPTEDVKSWFKEMNDAGIQITVVSNNNESRCQIFTQSLGVDFISAARKPLAKSFMEATKRMGVQKEEVVVMGDQVLTDVLGGNRAGYHTILVVPVAQTDGFWTKINRKFERMILNKFKKQGLLKWED